MTGLWSIVVPSAGVNYARNPALQRGDSFGWSAYTSGGGAGTVTRSPDAAMQGFFGMHIEKTGSTGLYGTVMSAVANNLFSSGQHVTMSVFVTIPAGTRATFEINVYNPSLLQTTVTQDGPFSGRLEGAVGPLTGASTNIGGRCYIPDGYGDEILVDGYQIEANTSTFSASTYFDGHTEGCYWSGIYYLSTSVRPVTVRDGGTIENFDDYGFFITGLSDIGMAGVNHNIDPYAVQDGALYRSSRTPRRVFNLSGELIGSSLSDLHDKRRALIDLFKNDATGQNDPFWLRYSGASGTLQIQCRYDSGLGGSRRPRDGFSERLSLRFIATDPFWRKTYNVGVDIPAQQAITTEAILVRVEGEWQRPHASINPATGINAIIHHEGILYVGGDFTTVGGDSDMSYIAQFDGTTWTALGTGANASVLALVVAPNGDLYAGGSFTSMGGVANTAYIARWDGSAWNALGTGTNGAVYTLAISTSNRLYVGGSFTTANGVPHNRIAPFDTDALSWGSAMSSGVDNNIVRALAVTPNNDLYIGGTFTSASSVSNTTYIARWDGSAFNALSTGLDDDVYALAAHPNGNVFLGGVFDDAGGVSVSEVAEWNGTTFLDMNGGASGDPVVNDLAVGGNGVLIIGGSFLSSMGGAGVTRLAFWNGTTYYPPDFNLNVSLKSFALGGKYDLITGGTNGNWTTSVKTTIINNGTRTTSPRFHIKPENDGASYEFSLYHLEIYESSSFIRFQPWEIGAEETIIIDVRPGRVEVTSNVTGNNLNAVNRASNMADFKLLPGSNSVIAFADFVDATYEISMIWDELFWSADGSS